MSYTLNDWWRDNQPPKRWPERLVNWLVMLIAGMVGWWIFIMAATS